MCIVTVAGSARIDDDGGRGIGHGRHIRGVVVEEHQHQYRPAQHHGSQGGGQGVGAWVMVRLG